MAADRATIQSGRYLVTLPACPNFSKQASLDYTNTLSSNYGCADKVNLAYGYKGSAVNKPDGVFDDGVKTYFRFSGDAPAIFEVLPGGDETLINYHREGEVVVVDKVAAQWTLRAGDEATCVFNLSASATPAPAKDVSPINVSAPEPAAPANAAAAIPPTPGTLVHVRY